MDICALNNKIEAMKNNLNIMMNLNKNGTAKAKKEYTIPSLSLLKSYRTNTLKPSIESIALEDKLSEFGFETSVEDIKHGPIISRYELKLAKGVKLSQVKNLSEDISLALTSSNIRILAPIPGTSLIGIEVPNEKQDIIGLRKVLSKTDKKATLPIALGVDTIGTPKTIDLAKMPHLLIAGQTGSGKSVFINNAILSILFTKTPEECQLVLVDPKRVEMISYQNIPHLRCPVVTESCEALSVFNSLIYEMEHRYKLLGYRRVKNIESYNKGTDKLPYIITIVDEMADLMMTSGKELETMIVRLAQLARAVGIHLILATQKPVVKVITGLIKSNMPSRISFQVASKVDSRVILDCNGAEQLIGRGDMLMMGPGFPEPERFHGAWVSEEEIISITDFIRGFHE